MSDAIPSASELLTTIRHFLETDITPQVNARSAYLLKVTTHLLDTLAREMQDGLQATTAETCRLQILLDMPNITTLNTLNRLLCERIRNGEQDMETPALWKHMLQATQARLAIDNPRYKYSQK